MGSLSGQQTKSFDLEHYIIDTIEHSLNRHLSFDALIPRLYCKEKQSLKQIATQLGVSRHLVRGKLSEHGIPLVSRKPRAYLQGHAPYGWKKEKGRLVPHAGEQQVLERIKKAHHKGFSLHSIARSLDISGVRTKNGGKWHAKTVSRLLGSDAAVLTRTRGKCYDGHPRNAHQSTDEIPAIRHLLLDKP